MRKMWLLPFYCLLIRNRIKEDEIENRDFFQLEWNYNFQAEASLNLFKKFKFIQNILKNRKIKLTIYEMFFFLIPWEKELYLDNLHKKIVLYNNKITVTGYPSFQ